MSKLSKQRARARKAKYAKPSLPRPIGANDNHPSAVNDNAAPVVIAGITLSDKMAGAFRQAEADQKAFEVGEDGRDIVIGVTEDNEPIKVPDLKRRREGYLAMLQIQQALESQLDASRIKAVREEIDGLEKTRGGKLTVERARDQRGEEGERLRVSRDGLATLAQEKTDRQTKEPIKPAIDHIQHTAGLRFRVDYERVDPERKLTPPTIMREGKSRGGGGEGYDAKIAESWGRIRTIYLMIAGVPTEAIQRRQDEYSGPTMPRLPAGHPAMRAIYALNEIAGKGMNLADMTSSGSVKERIREDLIFALDACAIVYGLE